MRLDIMKKRSHWLALLLIFVIIGGLFLSSSMTYQQQTSIPFLKHYLASQPGYYALSNIKFIYANKEESIAAVGYFKLVEFFIRKLAHFSIFGLLGSTTFWFLKDEIQNYFLAPWVAWFTVTGWAGFDEFHEMLTFGRTPLVEDVMLDSAGAFCGIIITILILFVYRKFSKKY